MSRRQKGPTNEELIEKLDTRLTEYQKANDENLEQFKTETKEAIERLSNEASVNSDNLNTEIKNIQSDFQNQHDLFDKRILDQTKTFNDTQDAVENLENELKNVQKSVTSLEENFHSLSNSLEHKIEANKEEVKNILDQNNQKITEDISEMKLELKSDIENMHKLFLENQEATDTKIKEINLSLASFNEMIENKMEENFNLLLSRMENDAKNSESIKDGQDVEMTALKDGLSN